MEKSKNKSVTLTAVAWTGILMMIAGVVILIFGLIPDSPFQVEFQTFKMSTPKTGIVIMGVGALISYLATKNPDVIVYSGGTKDQKFKRNAAKASIIIGVLAVALLIVFYILNF